MKIVLSIQNHQALCGLYVFDDGTLFVIDEKACSMIDSGGTVTESWWKEEPSGAHWRAILNYDGPEIAAPPRKSDDYPSPLENLCFGLSRLQVGDRVGTLPLPE